MKSVVEERLKGLKFSDLKYGQMYKKNDGTIIIPTSETEFMVLHSGANSYPVGSIHDNQPTFLFTPFHGKVTLST